MSFDLVLFGGTGDLVWRKLLPALFQAFRHGSLPQGGRIIGIGRDDLTHDQYRALIKSRFDNVELAKRPSEEEFTRFAALLEFVRARGVQTFAVSHSGCAWCACASARAAGTRRIVYFEKIRVFKAGVRAVNTLAWDNGVGL